MSAASSSPPALRLVTVGGASLLFDLGTGNYFRIDQAGELVCRALADSPSVPAAADQLVARHGFTAGQAEQALAAVLAAVRSHRVVPQPPGPLRYRTTSWGYALHHGTTPVIETSADGAFIRLCPGAPAAADPGDWVRRPIIAVRCPDRSDRGIGTVLPANRRGAGRKGLG